MPDLSRLDIRYEKGTGDMGSMTAGRSVGGPPPVEDANYATRFKVTDTDTAMSGLRVHFVGDTGTADLVIRVDSHRGEAYDMTLHTIEDCGVGADVNFRVPLDQQEHFYIEQDDEIVLIRTNPGGVNIEWGAALALVRRFVNAAR